MVYCAQFIDGIRRINFTGDDAALLRRVVFVSVLDDLNKQKKLLEGQIKGLSGMKDEDLTLDLQQRFKPHYRQLTTDLEALDRQIARIKAEESGLTELHAAVVDGTFIQNFTSYFRDISHLATTLSDAPSEIKMKQTELYIEILSKLSKADQEKQIATLDIGQLNDLMAEARNAYDRLPFGEEGNRLRHLYENIVHMTIFQCVRYASDTKESASDDSDINCHRYRNFIDKLRGQLLEVEKSTILDNLSHYRSSTGESVESCLRQVKVHFGIDSTNIWNKGIDAARAEKSLHHQLRFGQGARREFAEKRQDNAKRDLFWARNVHDIESFTNNPLTEAQFKALKERNHVVMHPEDYRESKEFDRSSHQANYCEGRAWLLKDPDALKALERMEHTLDHVKLTILNDLFRELNSLNFVTQLKTYLESTQKNYSMVRVSLSNSDVALMLKELKSLNYNALNRKEKEQLDQKFLDKFSSYDRMKFLTNWLNNIIKEKDENCPDYQKLIQIGSRKIWQPDVAKLVQYFNTSLEHEYSRPSVEYNSGTGNFQARFSYLNSKIVETEFTHWVSVGLKINTMNFDTILLRKSDSIIKSMLDSASNKPVKNSASAKAGVDKDEPAKEFVRNFSSHQFEGKTFEHISKLIDGLVIDGAKDQLVTAVKLAYQTSLTKIRQKALNEDSTAILNLNLPIHEELLLHKLIELHFVSQFRLDTPDKKGLFHISDVLKKAFSCIAPEPPHTVDYKGAVAVKGLSEVVDAAYVSIANYKVQKDELELILEPDTPRGIGLPFAKSQTIDGSVTPSATASSPGVVPIIPLGKLTNKNKFEALSESAKTKRVVEIGSVDSQFRQIAKNAQSRVNSGRIRAERARKLDDVFSRQLSNESEAIDAIQKIYMEEYTDMAGHLGISDENQKIMETHINAMATELVRLVSRAQSGQAALSDTETTEYFRVIGELVKAVPKGRSLSDYRFTIPSMVEGTQPIKLIPIQNETKKDTESIQVEVHLGNGLPYSLIKPPGDSEIMFSFGGDRGVVAPFAEFDKAYAQSNPSKKPRYFTHGRLLGVGQYGSVQAVEQFLSGLNEALKEGIVESALDNSSTQSLVASHRTRSLISKVDKLAAVEGSILSALSLAERTEGKKESIAAQYWQSGLEGRQSYHLFMSRAEGETFADTANKELTLFSKADDRYHDPVKRVNLFQLDVLKERLALSAAITQETVRLRTLGFTHNDIKPENFLYKRQTDGHYTVQFIDWATAGFKRNYIGIKSTDKEIFEEVFGKESLNLVALPLFKNGDTVHQDAQGRFVLKDKLGQFFYGINPRLEILHGARNGTLSYLSPLVLKDKKNNNKLQCVSAGKVDANLTTIKLHDDPGLDNYALTAMQFGICSRYAYFNLVKGRTVVDYVIPGILDLDNQDPLGLKIVDLQKFNQYFSCDNELKNQDDIFTDETAVMYIPGNGREGEPLHLFRHLRALRQELLKNKFLDLLEIQSSIDSVLETVSKSIASGQGLKPDALIAQVELAQKCISEYEKLSNPGYLKEAQHAAVLTAILNQYSGADSVVNLDDLLSKVEGHGMSQFEVLCTYPTTKEDKAKVLDILNKAIPDASQLSDKCLEEKAPYHHIIQKAMDKGQAELVEFFLSRIKMTKSEERRKEWIQLIESQDLLHYALEEKLQYLDEKGHPVTVAAAIVDTLKTLDFGAKIPELMMKEDHPQSHIHWATNALRIAIQNNSEEQLDLILKNLPSKAEFKEQIDDALLFSALLKRPTLFSMILQEYPKEPKAILELKSLLDGSSPYHLFLRDRASVQSIVLPAFEKFSPELKKNFLLNSPITALTPSTSRGLLTRSSDIVRSLDSADKPEPYSILIAAKYQDYDTVSKLIEFAQDPQTQLSIEEKKSLFGQKDAYGKNLLNYILEHKQYIEVGKLITAITTACGQVDGSAVLSDLVCNLVQVPGKPPINFLDEEHDSETKYKILTQLCDALSENAVTENDQKSTPDQEKARLVAMILNESWLIDQANNPSQHDKLKVLMHTNPGLALPQKAFLYTRLRDAAEQLHPDKKGAIDFYKNLLSEVTPQLTETMKQKNNIDWVDVLERVATASGKPIDALETIIRQSREILGLQSKQVELGLLIRELKFQMNHNDLLAREELGRASILKEELEEMGELRRLKMEFLSGQVQSLSQQAQDELFRFNQEKEELERNIALGNEAAADQLDLAQKKHEQIFGEIYKKLIGSDEAGQDTADGRLMEIFTAVEVKERQILELRDQNQRSASELEKMRSFGEKDKEEIERLKRMAADMAAEQNKKMIHSVEELEQARRQVIQVEMDTLMQTAKIDFLKTQIGEKDVETKRLSEQSIQLTSTMDEQQKTVTSLNEDLEKLGQAKSKLEGKTVNLELNLLEKDREIQQLQEDTATNKTEIDRLIAQRNSVSSELSTMQQEKQEIDFKIQQLAIELEHAESFSQLLGSEFFSLREQYGTLAKRFTDMEYENNGLNDNLVSLEAQKQATEGKLRDAMDKVKELEGATDQNLVLTSEINRLKEELTRITEELRAETERSSDQLTQKDEISQQLGLAQTELSAIREELADNTKLNESEKTQLNDKLLAIYAKNNQLEKQLLAQAGELGKSKDRVKNLQEELNANTLQRIVFEEEVGRNRLISEEEKGFFSIDLSNLRDQNNQLNSTIIQTQDVLQTQVKENSSLSDQVGNLQAKNDGLVEKYESQESMLSDLNQKLKVVTTEIETQHKSIEEILTQLEREKGRLSQSEWEVDQLRNKLNEADKSHQKQIECIESAKSTLFDKEQALLEEKERHETEKEILQDKLCEVESNLAIQKEQSTRQKNVLEEQNRNIIKMTLQLSELEKKIEEMQTDKQLSTEKTRELEELWEDKEKALQTLLLKNQDLLKKAEAQNDIQLKNLKILGTENQGLLANVQSLEKQVSDLTKEVAESSTELQTQVEHGNALQSKLEEEKKSVEILSQEQRRLEALIEQEKNSYREKIEKIEASADKEKIFALQEANQKHGKAMGDIQERLNELERAKSAIHTINEELKKQLDKTTTTVDQLKQDLKAKEQEIVSVQADLVLSGSDNQGLREELEILRLQINENKSSLEDVTNSLRKTETERDSLKTQIESLGELNQNLQNDNTDMKKLLEDLTKNVSLLEFEKQFLNLQVIEQELNLKKGSEHLQDLVRQQSESAKLIEEKQQEHLAEIKVHLDDFNQKLNAKDADKEVLQSKHEELIALLNLKHQEEVDQLNVKLSQWGIESEEFQRKTLNQEEKIQELSSKNTDLVIECRRYKSEIDNFEIRFAEREEENSVLKKDLSDVRERYQEVSSESDALTERLAEWKKSCETLNSCVIELVDKNKNLVDENQTLLGEVEKLTEKLGDVRGELSEEKRLAVAAKRQLKSAKEMNAALQEGKGRLEIQLQQMGEGHEKEKLSLNQQITILTEASTLTEKQMLMLNEQLEEKQKVESEMRGKLEALERQHLELNERSAALENKNSAINTQLSEQVKAFELERTQALETAEKLDSEIQNLSQDLEKARLEIQSQEIVVTEHKQLNTKVQTLSQKNKELEENTKTISAQVYDLTIESEKIRNALQDENKRVVKLSEERDRIKAELTKAENAQKEMEAFLSEKERKYANQIRDITNNGEAENKALQAKYNEEMSALRSQIQVNQNEREKMGEQLNQQAVELDDATNNTIELNSRLVTMMAHNVDLQKQLDEEKNLSAKAKKDLQVTLDQSKKTAENAQAETRTLNEQLSNATLNNKEQEARLNALSEYGSKLFFEFEERERGLMNEWCESDFRRLTEEFAAGLNKSAGNQSRSPSVETVANEDNVTPNTDENKPSGTIISNVSRTSSVVSTNPRKLFDLPSPYFVYAPTQRKTFGELFPLTSSDAANNIQIDFPIGRKLTDREQLEVETKGLDLFSPTGHQYKFSDINGRQEAFLSSQDAGAPLDSTESSEQTEQRLAVTIMNMIDNVLAKGSTTIDVQTDDPFVAGVAKGYIEYLIERKYLALTVGNISDFSGDESKQLTQNKGMEVFKTINNTLSTKENPALKERQAKISPLNTTQAYKNQLPHGNSANESPLGDDKFFNPGTK